MINIDNTTLGKLDCWGHSCTPYPQHNRLGYAGVLFMLQNTADSNHFFSPTSLHIHTIEPDGHAYWETLRHDTVSLPVHAIYPGKLHLRDKHGEEMVFFSFGAHIDMEKDDDKTIFSIRSKAPILELSLKNKTIANDMADEVEGMLARLEVQWQLHQANTATFSQYIAQTFPPQHLYTTSIYTLLTYYEKEPDFHHSSLDLYHQLEQEKLVLQENSQWPLIISSFDDLFTSKSSLLPKT